MAGYEAKVAEVMGFYGLFIVELDEVMPFAAAEEKGIVTDELLEQFADTVQNEKFCIYGTLHSYRTDN